MTAGDGGSGGVALGVDVGGTKLLGVAVRGDGSICSELRLATPTAATDPGPPNGAGAFAEAVAEVVWGLTRPEEPARLAGQAGTRTSPGVRVGVGVPGMVDHRGRLRFSPNLPGASGADVAPLVAERLRSRGVDVEGVSVANDANCAALAELRLGSARGARDALVVTLGTGIGCGLISGGTVRTGAGGFAGEVGHMVVDPSGPPCPCGRRGCWERFASGGGLARLAREAAYAGTLQRPVALAGGDPEMVRGEHVTTSAQEGHPGSLAVMAQLGWWVALGLANLVALFDPELVVVGGGLAEVGELLLEPTRRAFATLVEGSAARPTVRIVAAAFGERSGAVGAALMARSGGL